MLSLPENLILHIMIRHKKIYRPSKSPDTQKFNLVSRIQVGGKKINHTRLAAWFHSNPVGARVQSLYSNNRGVRVPIESIFILKYLVVQPRAEQLLSILSEEDTENRMKKVFRQRIL